MDNLLPAPLVTTERYFDRPTSSLTPTFQTSTSTRDSIPHQPPRSRLLHLHFSGRDLPEPDARSRASYAVIYHALEVPARLSTVSDVSITRTAPDASTSRGPSASMKRRSSTPALVRAVSAPVSRLKPKSSAHRAPAAAAAFAAPTTPEHIVADDGTSVMRSAWTKLATTDVARKFGRDVEFSKAFPFHYIPGTGQVIRVAFFDCTSKKVEKQRLIGTAQLRVSAVYAAQGRPVTFPLKFLPVNEKDVKRSNKIPHGSLLVTGERMDVERGIFYIDAECNPIVRAKALSSASVRRIFYTIHAVLDKKPDSDFWTLIFRSETVDKINRKQDGGSLEYNYFTSRRVVAKPGFIIEDVDAKERQRQLQFARGESVKSQGSLLNKGKKLLGIKIKKQFFSLPSANLNLAGDDIKLKLSLFEDKGSVGGFDLIADTEFRIADLRSRGLGESVPIRVHSNTVGKAVLKYVECGPNPTYFCLSLEMQGLR
ncbi:unnamed protein product [Chondrus crispus]|uniref:Uncharacterized protein n=1 Tax=Chondrus crispus TaxID=2769 RepID=R7Q6D9_CHOCR|nr:unnamed protein product [Chondrus crispus]CDF33408.1 unnamed protein product [Chondrus crispus]|eukprot:XP_005713211.1 unnamed protein product [Chondrus crispus]